ncbi:MAG: hypothetical protein COA77_07295 [Thaumarchaeota archaeon]|nr:MAG: hypothetical protein COA77_07295 [Nitrososphaerota archaeon]
MAQVCTGICERYKKEAITEKMKQTVSLPNNFRYDTGQKYCTLCSLFFFTNKVTCPCCKTRLRNKSRRKQNMTYID